MQKITEPTNLKTALPIFQAALRQLHTEFGVAINDDYQSIGKDFHQEAINYGDAAIAPQNSPYPKKALHALWCFSLVLAEINTKPAAELNNTSIATNLNITLGYLENRATNEEGSDWWALKVRDEGTAKLARVFLTLLESIKTENAILNLFPDPNSMTGKLIGGWDYKKQLFIVIPKLLKERLTNFEQLQAYARQLDDYIANQPQLTIPASLRDHSNDSLHTTLPRAPESTESDAKTRLLAEQQFYQTLADELSNYDNQLDQHAENLQNYCDGISNQPSPQSNPTFQAMLNDKKRVLNESKIKNTAQKTTVQQLIQATTARLEEITRQLDDLNPDSWTNRLREAEEKIKTATAAQSETLEDFAPQILPVSDDTLQQISNQAAARKLFLENGIKILTHFHTVISAKDGYGNLPSDNGIPTSGFLIEYFDNNIYNAYAAKIWFQRARLWARSGLTGLSFLLSDYQPIPWQIHAPDHTEASQRIATLERTGWLQQQEDTLDYISFTIKRMKAELAINVMDSTPNAIDSSPLAKLQRDYQAEQNRPTVERTQLALLNNLHTQLQQVAPLEATLAYQAVERDYKLNQAQKKLEDIKKLIESLAHKNPQTALNALTKSKDYHELQQLIDQVSNANNVIAGDLNEQLQPAINALSDVSAQLPAQALAKRTQLLSQKTTLTNTSKTLEASVETTKTQLSQLVNDTLPKMRIQLDIAKLSTLKRAYEKLLELNQFNLVRRLEELREKRQTLNNEYKDFLEACKRQKPTKPLYQEIESCQQQLQTLEEELQRKIASANSTFTTEQKQYDQARAKFSKIFFNGKLPTSVFHSIELTYGEGVFNRYLKHRHRDYFWKDLLTNFLSFCLTGKMVKTDQERRINYLHKLEKATAAYQKDPSKIQPLQKLIDEGLKKPDPSKLRFMQPSIFQSRQAKGTQEGYTLQHHLHLFKKELERIEKLRPKLTDEYSLNNQR